MKILPLVCVISAFLVQLAFAMVIDDDVIYLKSLDALYDYDKHATNIYINPEENFPLQELKPITSAKAGRISRIFINEAVNSIDENALKSLTNLNFFTILRGKIPKLKKGIFNGLKVTDLEIMFSNVEEIEDGTFEDLPNLYHLRLDGNKLQVIKKGYLNDLTTEILDLSQNKIVEIQEKSLGNLPKLTILMLSRNSLSEIIVSNIVDFPGKLRILWLSENKLTKISKECFKGLTDLEILNLSSNDISILEPEAFADNANLKNLLLDHNQLHEIGDVLPPSGLKNLESLNLDHNKIHHFDSSFLEQIKTVDKITISDNPLECPSLYEVIFWSKQNGCKFRCTEDFQSGTKMECFGPNRTVITEPITCTF